MPRLLLVGRDSDRLAAVARTHNITEWTTDLDTALSDPAWAIFFDAAATQQRVGVLAKALAAGKHVYSEKPVAPTAAQGRALLRDADARGRKHGAVEDKVYLPGLQKLAALTQRGELGRILGFRLEFGWWVFDGNDRPAQRPSWNYRAGGGGLILDMYPHWRYVIETIIGRIVRVASAEWIATPERIDEQGERYPVAVEDSATTMVELEGGAFGTILSSWATRVRRDDLLTLQVDGTKGSAVAGLHRCHVQSAAQTPAIAHFSVMKDIAADYRSEWVDAPALAAYRNPYRVGWEQFLRHVAADAPLASDFTAGIRDVAFAEACHRSMAERTWIAFPPPGKVP
jgi:predicted dehydrogenase